MHTFLNLKLIDEKRRLQYDNPEFRLNRLIRFLTTSQTRTQLNERFKSIEEVLNSPHTLKKLNLDSKQVEHYRKDLEATRRNQLLDIRKRQLDRRLANRPNNFSELDAIGNRAGFEEQYEYYFRELLAEREKFPVSFIFNDIVKFKWINQFFGKEVGDDIIIRFNQTIEKNTRRISEAFRNRPEDEIYTNAGHAGVSNMGGDETVSVFRNTDKVAVSIVQNKLQSHFEKLTIPEAIISRDSGKPIKVSVLAGEKKRLAAALIRQMAPWINAPHTGMGGFFKTLKKVIKANQELAFLLEIPKDARRRKMIYERFLKKKNFYFVFDQKETATSLRKEISIQVRQAGVVLTSKNLPTLGELYGKFSQMLKTLKTQGELMAVAESQDVVLEEKSLNALESGFENLPEIVKGIDTGLKTIPIKEANAFDPQFEKISKAYVMTKHQNIRRSVTKLRDFHDSQFRVYYEIFNQLPDQPNLLDEVNIYRFVPGTISFWNEQNHEGDFSAISDLNLKNRLILALQQKKQNIIRVDDQGLVHILFPIVHTIYGKQIISVLELNFNDVEKFDFERRDLLFILNDYKKNLKKVLEDRMVQKSLMEQTLTRLPNKTAYLNALENKISQNKPFSTAIFDIRAFKRINDDFSYATGDFVIKEIAMILEAVCGLGRVYHWHGDEFAILVEDGSAPAFRKLMQQIFDSVRFRRVRGVDLGWGILDRPDVVTFNTRSFIQNEIPGSQLQVWGVDITGGVAHFEPLPLREMDIEKIKTRLLKSAENNLERVKMDMEYLGEGIFDEKSVPIYRPTQKHHRIILPPENI